MPPFSVTGLQLATYYDRQMSKMKKASLLAQDGLAEH